MKTKIFALIAAILCFSMIATSCFKKDCEEHVDEDNDAICDVCEAEIKAAPDTVACTEHKDENADKTCDVCGGAIVVVTQLQKPDVADRVPMVVKPMPSDVNLSDYLLLNKPAAEAVTVTKQDNSWTDYVGNYYYYKTVDSYYVEHKIVDVESNNVIFSQKVDYETYGDRMAINLYADCYTVENRNYTSNSNGYYYATHCELSVYAYGNSQAIDTVKWTADVDNYNYNYDKDGYTWNTYVDRELDVYSYGDYSYVRIDDTVYIIDSESKTVMETMQSDVYVSRPTFTMKNDDYGVVYLNGYFYSYNLNKWLDCVSSFQLPTSGNYNYWMLANGKILVQNILPLEDRAVSYDYIDGGKKYDITYTVYDPATGNAENVEFGYYINSLSAISEESTVYDGTKDLNGVTVKAIVNDRLVNTTISLLVNSDLNILLNITEMFGRNTTWEVVANNRFVTLEYYSNSQYRIALYDENGAFIAYVPNGAEVEDFYISFDGKYYDFDMNLVLDSSEKGYTEYSVQDDFMILRDYNYEYYYFDGKNAPKKITIKEGETLYYVGDFGYIISYQEYTSSGYEYYTVIYSANNTKVKTLNDFRVNYVNNYTDGVHMEGYNYSTGSGMYETWIIK